MDHNILKDCVAFICRVQAVQEVFLTLKMEALQWSEGAQTSSYKILKIFMKG
jgi:hypothetical protein